VDALFDPGRLDGRLKEHEALVDEPRLAFAVLSLLRTEEARPDGLADIFARQLPAVRAIVELPSAVRARRVDVLLQRALSAANEGAASGLQKPTWAWRQGKFEFGRIISSYLRSRARPGGTPSPVRPRRHRGGRAAAGGFNQTRKVYPQRFRGKRTELLVLGERRAGR